MVRRLCKVLVPLVFWLAVWEALAVLTGSALLLPGPGQVALRLGRLALTAPFWRACATTLGRIFLGGALGALAGAAVAALSAWQEWAGWVLTPFMKVVRATPVASFIILIWLWCTSRWVPVVIAALMSAPVVWGATAQAIAAVDPKLLEMAAAYRFTPGKTLGLIYVPSVRPAVAAGCKTAMGLAWKAGVAAEVLCRPRWALGTQVYNAKLAMETADLFAWTAAVVLLSLLVERGLRLLLERGERRGAS